LWSAQSLARKLLAGLLAGGTRAGELLEVLDEVRLVGRQIAAPVPLHDGRGLVEEIDAGVGQQGDVPRRRDAGKQQGGVGGDRLPDGHDGLGCAAPWPITDWTFERA